MKQRSAGLYIAIFIICMILLTGESILNAQKIKSDLSVGEQGFLKRIKRDCKVVQLWPGGIGPDETKPDLKEEFTESEEKGGKIRPVLKPSMIIIPPPEGSRSTGVTVMLCPGGGYGSLSTYTIELSHKWLNAMGVTTVLLKYRIPKRGKDLLRHQLPLQDAQRALGLLRSRAKEWGLDPEKIGVGGFSAGGHLAAMLGNHHTRRTYKLVDEHDKASCRPDFTILHYPAYLTKPIVSLEADPALDQDNLSSERTPPTFITITCPDKFTYGCVNYLWALQRAKVPAELHVFPVGGHSGSFNKYPLMEYARSGARFLFDHSIIDEQSRGDGNAWLDKHIPEVKKLLLAKKKKSLPIEKTLSDKYQGIINIQGVKESEYTPGEKEVLKLLDNPKSIIPLWPGAGTRKDDPLKPIEEQPGSTKKGFLMVGKVTRPGMMIFRPERPDGRAVLVFPGGGYGKLAIDHEGVQIAKWLNSQGITAFLVKYRVPRRAEKEKHFAALQDAQRAIRLVRSRAGDFKINPDKIGVLGFSAGGHLSALTCLQHENSSYEPIDEHDKVSSRPDFGVLIYKAYSTLTKKGTELDPLLSSPNRKKTPSMFMAIAADDQFMAGSLRFFLKLKEAKLPVECHVYEKGGHGQGLLKSAYPFSQWTEACERWLRDLEEGFATN